METLKCWLTDFPWGVFLGCLLPLLTLWWWMNRQINRLKTHSGELQDRINFLEGELDACRKSKVSVETKGAGLAGAVVAGAVGLAAGATNAKKDDLKIVEGIGPKIEELFNNAGIYTFAQLASSSVEKMKSILDSAGPRFQIHDPSTWANQSALARDGKWDELKKWQDELHKGKA
jgi:predicted flap endonuclease-1-like 5' DNA nuclease